MGHALRTSSSKSARDRRRITRVAVPARFRHQRRVRQGGAVPNLPVWGFKTPHANRDPRGDERRRLGGELGEAKRLAQHVEGVDLGDVDALRCALGAAARADVLAVVSLRLIRVGRQSSVINSLGFE